MPVPSSQLDLYELAYLAGFLDGEGCIMLPRVKRKHGFSHRLAVVVDNMSDAALWRFALCFGGSVIRIKHTRENQRDHFRWTVTDKRAEKVLRVLLPYLRVKKQQAEVGIQFRLVNSRGQVLPMPEQERRLSLVGKIHKLNARGPEAPLRYAN